MSEEGRSRRATNRNLGRALTAIDRIAKDNDISSDARATATSLYQQTLKKHDTLYGWDIETAASACLYLACKIEREGISPGEIANGNSNVEEKLLLRRAKQLRTELGLEYIDIVDPSQYVEQYIDELGASEELHERAKNIVDVISDTPLVSGRNPRAIAAAAIYNASLDSGERITQTKIAEIADLTEVTIRNRYQEQREYLEQSSENS